MHSYLSKTSFLLLCLFTACIGCTVAHAADADDEMKVLQLFYHDNDLVVTPSRTAKPINQVAENITVVTAEEIEAFNAHSVADVLNTVVGLQVANSIMPGGWAAVTILGAHPKYVLVMIDGVSQNSLMEGTADVGALRVQHIERIEIIKGAASSSWGSSLGGVVNIITKSPDESKKFGGGVSASIGEGSTGDYRGEVSGTAGAFGYYLSGGGLFSEGFRPDTRLSSGNLYSKLKWQPRQGSLLTFTLSYDSSFRGLGQAPIPELDLTISTRSRYDNFFTTLAFNKSLVEGLTLDMAARGSVKNMGISYREVGTGLEFRNFSNIEKSIGGSARLIWERGKHTLVVGTDLDFGKIVTANFTNGPTHQDKWALYANTTLKFGRFTLTPGIRYDNISIKDDLYAGARGDFLSPSFGATVTINDSTVVRGYVAKGFNVPPLADLFGTGLFSMPNPNLKMERVWSYSLGFETAALKYAWLKASYFHHSVSDAIIVPEGAYQPVNYGKQLREGVEIELKTTPVYHLSFAGGFTFINAKDRTTGKYAGGIPRLSYDIGLQYDDSRFLRAVLKGRYIDWNSYPDGKYNAIIWDLNLSRKFPFKSGITGEAFFTAHNIFNGAQYLNSIYRNPRQWFEGGLRFSF
jgi:vitamin B12 transporter